MHNTRTLVRNKDICDNLTYHKIFRNEVTIINIKKKLAAVRKAVKMYGCPSKQNELAIKNVLIEYIYGINVSALKFQFTRSELSLYNCITATTDRLKRDLNLRYNDTNFIYCDKPQSHIINDNDRKRIKNLLKIIKKIENIVQHINLNSEKFLQDTFLNHRVNHDVIKTIIEFL